MRRRASAPARDPRAWAWDELEAGLRPERFTVRTVPRRLAALRRDPWAGYAPAARPLEAAHLAAVAGPRAEADRRA